MQPYQMNSVRVYGLEPFLMEPEVVYLHTAEMAMLANPQLVIPTGGDSVYLHGYPNWADSLITEGMPWFPGEKRILDHITSLIPVLSKKGEQDPVHQLLRKQEVEIAPFAVPIVFRTKTGRTSPGKGFATRDKKKILLLRHYVAKDPLGQLMILYHEGLHIAENANELEAHQGQLELCTAAIDWLSSRELDAVDKPARFQMSRMLSTMRNGLIAAIEELS